MTRSRWVGAALVACCLGSTVASPLAHAQPEPDEAFDQSFPAPLVIDTTDGTSIFDDPLLADALATVEREQSQQRLDVASRATTSDGHLQVVYLTSPPDEVRIVIEAAATAWDGVLTTNPNGPIVIEVDWRFLPANILGIAAPTTFERSSDLPTDALYPAALANTLLGTDRTPDQAEIQITLAANLYGLSNGWHVDPSVSINPTLRSNRPVPLDKLDLYTVAIHEIAHGLGFAGSARSGQLGDELVAYDLLAEVNGVPLIETNVRESLTSQNLSIDIAGGRTEQLFAPPNFVNAVSYNHFDELDDPSEPGGLMTPIFARGEENRTIDAATLGVMSGLGWDVVPPLVTPRIVRVESVGDNLEITFTNNIGRTGQPPIAHRITARAADQTLLADIQEPWDVDQTVIRGLADGRDITITVEPLGLTGPGPTASVTLTDRPSRLRVTGVGATRSLAWSAPTAPSAGEITYRVERRTINGPWRTLTDAAEPFFTDAGLTTGNYQYRVTTLVDGAAGSSAVTPIEGVTTETVRAMSLDGQVARLYLAFFGRPADTPGLAFWLEQRASGATIDDIAAAFADSDEFRALAGDPDDAAFVDKVYLNVLGRSPDAAGRDFWVGRLASGMSRGELVVAFSDAPEFVSLTDTVPPTSGSAGAVTRLYWAFLQRAPEGAGLNYWSGEVDAGRADLSTVSDSFANSAEFAATYGTLSNQEFLDLVYDNVLGRRADDRGFNYWLSQLEAGASRGDLMLAFANSPEFILRTGTLP